MLLCPSLSFTCRMSFVRWYSMVAPQCRKVWKVIRVILGFWSLCAILARWLMKFWRSLVRVEVPNNRWFVLGSMLSIAVSLELILNWRGAPFFLVYKNDGWCNLLTWLTIVFLHFSEKRRIYSYFTTFFYNSTLFYIISSYACMQKSRRSISLTQILE